MSRILKYIRDSLSMSAHEAKGVVVAFGVSIGALLVMWGADYFFSQETQNLLISSPKTLDSLTFTLEQRNKEYQDKHQFETQNSESRPKVYKYFDFDPNTATVAQLQQLGLPKFIAERVEKYRNKGGRFRKKEDLAKIYGLPPETYKKLEPYIILASAKEETIEVPAEKIEQLFTVEKNVATTLKKIETPSRFDLNMADTSQLKLIKGIGSGYAKRIIKFRDVLGGFANAEQIRETYGLPTETADELLKYGYVNGTIKKVKINQLSVSDLKHPYLKFAQARAIVAYREQHGKFKSVDDLRQLKLLDEATIQKIEPYLEF